MLDVQLWAAIRGTGWALSAACRETMRDMMAETRGAGLPDSNTDTVVEDTYHERASPLPCHVLHWIGPQGQSKCQLAELIPGYLTREQF